MPMEEFLDELHLSCPRTRTIVADIFNSISSDFNTDLIELDRKFPGFYQHFFQANYTKVEIITGSTVAFS